MSISVAESTPPPAGPSPTPPAPPRQPAPGALPVPGRPGVRRAAVPRRAGAADHRAGPALSTADTSWILTAYLLSASVLTPILGRLGDMVGKRRVLIGVLAALAVGTLVAALAPSLGVLIVARVLQGSAGAILPLSIGIVRDELPREKVSVTVGLLSAIFGVGAGVGIVAAGPIVEHLSWHWLFWLPLVLVVIALLGADLRHEGVAGAHARPARRARRRHPPVGLVSLLLAISKGQAWGWVETKTVGLFVLGVVALVAFVLVELRVQRAADRHAPDGQPRRVGHRPGRPDPRLRDVRHVPAGPDAARAARRHRLRLRQVGLRGGPVPAARPS